MRFWDKFTSFKIQICKYINHRKFLAETRRRDSFLRVSRKIQMMVDKWIWYANVGLQFQRQQKRYRNAFCSLDCNGNLLFGNMQRKICLFAIMLISIRQQSNIFCHLISTCNFYFTFSLINYLKEVLVLVGVSVRWYMQTNFSRYYIFPYDVVYLLSFHLSP